MTRIASYISAIVLLALVACNRIDDSDSSQTIGFSVGSIVTKAGVTTANITTSGSAFIVRGSVCSGSTWTSGSATTLFNGVTVTSNGTAWTYSPVQYWYRSSAYHFRAVWPAGAFGSSAASYSDALTGSDATISGFTTGSNADTDLVLSDLETITTDSEAEPSSANDKVNLTFRHILSNVKVSVAKQDEGADIRLVGVQLSGVKNNGSYVGTSLSGTWTPSGNATYSKTFATPVALDDTDFTSAWNEGLFLIPQSLSGITLTVTYKEGADGAAQTVSASLGSSSWVLGKSYEYQATISTSEIEFTVKVVDWVTGTTITLHK